MHFLVSAIIPVITAVLVAACSSPVSPKPDNPADKPQQAVNDVNYFGNGNTAGEVPVDTAKYAPGKDPVILQDQGNLYKVGYRFTGWNTKADGSGTLYQAKEQITRGNEPVELYAQWEEVFPRVSAGEHFSTLITKAGALYAAGYNANGRLGDNSNNNRHEFVPITTNINEPVRSVSSGTDHSFAILQSGGIVGWGQGDWGKLGLDQENGTSLIPKIPSFAGMAGVTSLGEVRYISTGRNQTALLNNKGEYWAAGTKTRGALGNGEPSGNSTEKQFRLVAKNIISVATGENYILLIDKDGTMWIAGEGADGKLGTANTNNVPKLRKNTAIDNNNSMVFAGKNNHSMVLKKDGRVLSTGNNSSGQLGHGNTANKTYFAPVINTEDTEMTDAAFVSLGANHSMILKKDGTLWAMGRNNEFQLGLNSTANQLKAVKVLDNVAHVAAGYTHTIAVKADGTLWATGSNAYGQFGQKASNVNSVWTQIDISSIQAPLTPATP